MLLQKLLNIEPFLKLVTYFVVFFIFSLLRSDSNAVTKESRFEMHGSTKTCLKLRHVSLLYSTDMGNGRKDRKGIVD